MVPLVGQGIKLSDPKDTSDLTANLNSLLQRATSIGELQNMIDHDVDSS